jgi:hypothetical protein
MWLLDQCEIVPLRPLSSVQQHAAHFGTTAGGMSSSWNNSDRQRGAGTGEITHSGPVGYGLSSGYPAAVVTELVSGSRRDRRRAASRLRKKKSV